MHRILATLLLLLPAVTLADSSAIKVDQVWSRAALAGREGVIYLSITNAGPADNLTGISTPVAATAELHRTINENGVMKMRGVPSLPIGPGKTVTLSPSGYHIMLMNLKQPLKQGDRFPVMLTFEKAGQVTATALVEKAGATSRSMSDTADHTNMPMSGGTKP